MNRDWHKQHPMPPAATAEVRVEWHLKHTKNCSCRPFPQGLLSRLSEEEKRQLADALERRQSPLELIE
jgi:hypothetical protein